MAKITKKKSISIKGVLQISKDNDEIYVEVEDGETLSLARLLADFDSCEVAVNVTESVELA